MYGLSRFILFIILILFSKIAFAQVNVSGVVSSKGEKDGEIIKIQGVHISIEGKNKKKNYAVTNAQGEYKIEVAMGDVLVFSFLGMMEKRITVTQQNSQIINVIMNYDIEILEDIVVSTGYQKKDIKTLTGSVVKVKKELINNRPTARVSDLLAGVAPGLLVTRNNPGRIGGTTTITSQGGGFRSSSGMLVVIDGLPQSENFNINTVNPNDIESINILRDSEAVIYGSRAANGVIVITTKKGGATPKINVTSSFNYKVPTIRFKAQDIVEFLSQMDEAYTLQKDTLARFSELIKYVKDNKITSAILKQNTNKALKDIPLVTGPWPDVYGTHMADWDWSELMYGTAIDRNNSISFSGSLKDQGLAYYASIGNSDEQSLLKYGKNSRSTLFANTKLDFSPKDWVQLGVNINSSFSNEVIPTDINQAETSLTSRAGWQAPFDDNQRPLRWGGFTSPIAHFRDGGENNIKTNRYQGQFYVDVKPIKDLSIKVTAQKSFYDFNALSIRKKAKNYRYNSDATSFINSRTVVNRTTNKNTSFIGLLSVNYTFTLDDINSFEIFGNYTHEEFDRKSIFVGRYDVFNENIPDLDLANDEITDLSDTHTEEAITGLSTNIRYTLLGRYTLEGYFRQDGSSRFAKGHKFSNFYGGGLAYTLSDEDFFKQFVPEDIVSNLKFRFTYGNLASRDGIGMYDFSETIAIDKSEILFGTPGSYTLQQRARLSNPASNDRTWMIINKRNFGFNLGFLENKLTMVIDIYRSTSDNGFYNNEVPNSFGASSPQINGAEYTNNGWEFAINWKDKIKDFQYTTSFGISDNIIKTVKLPDRRTVSYGNNPWVEGQENNIYYGYKFDGLVKTQADLDDYKNKVLVTHNGFGIGDAKYRDMDGDGKLEQTPYKVGKDGKPTDDSGDLIALKSTNPHLYYFINFNGSYKGFGFSMVLNGVGEWYTYDRRHISYGFPWAIREKSTYKIGYHPQNRPNTNVPRYYAAVEGWNNSINSWNYIYSDGAHIQKNVPYLRIQNIQLSYTLPMEWTNLIKLQKLKMFVNLQDLGYLINYMSDSYSPEQPFNRSIVPYVATYSFGLNIDVN